MRTCGIVHKLAYGGRVSEGMAYLSVRVPEDVRNRLKAAAATRGERLQDLVGGLVERFLAETERRPPELADVLQRLRSIQGSLRARGVMSLWVFGSVARGDARPDSDVDLAIEFAPDAMPSLFEIAHIRDDAQAAIGRSVDLGERSTMTSAAAAAAEGEMVRAF